MALVTYVTGGFVTFNAVADVLQFSSTSVRASALQIQQAGANLQVGVAGQFIAFLNTSFVSLSKAGIASGDPSRTGCRLKSFAWPGAYNPSA